MITGPIEFHPYDLPLPNQILPCYILNEEAMGLVAELEAKGKDSALGKLGYEIKQQNNVFMWAMWVSISAKLKDLGNRQSVQVQYQAVPQDDGSLGLNEPMPVNVFSVPQAALHSSPPLHSTPLLRSTPVRSSLSTPVRSSLSIPLRSAPLSPLRSAPLLSRHSAPPSLPPLRSARPPSAPLVLASVKKCAPAWPQAGVPQAEEAAFFAPWLGYG